VHTLIRNKLAMQDIMTETPDLVSWRQMAGNVDAAAAAVKNATATGEGKVGCTCIHAYI
jgi:hypothetical protein